MTLKNEVWSYDFIQDRKVDGRRLKILVVVDEYTRECPALELGRTLTAGEVIGVLGRLVRKRGALVHLGSYNEPEYMARGVRRLPRVRDKGTLHIAPGTRGRTRIVSHSIAG